MTSRILVTGAEGMIGRAVRFGVKCSRREMDILNLDQVKRTLDRHAPEVILHLASNDMQSCEQDPVAGLAVNTMATRSLAQEARERGIRLIFLSSATVFSGPRGAIFNEKAKPSPLNIYGMSKLLAELAIQDIMSDFLIVRVGWVFGGHGAHQPKFVDVAMGAALQGRPIWGNRDQEGSPLYIEDLVDELNRLIHQGARGIRHLANNGAATGYDIGQAIVDLTSSRSRISDSLEANPSSRIARSASEVLTSEHGVLRPWRQALNAYLSVFVEREIQMKSDQPASQ